MQYHKRTVKDFLESEDVRKYLLLRTSDTPFNPDVSLLKGSILQVKIHDVSQKAPRCYDLATEAMAYALQVDKAQVSQTALLDDLDTNHQQHLLAVGVVGPSCQVPQPKQWQESFLALAIEWGLVRHITSKLSVDLSLIKDPSRPLLHYAVYPLPLKEAKLTYQSTYPVSLV